MRGRPALRHVSCRGFDPRYSRFRRTRTSGGRGRDARSPLDGATGQNGLSQAAAFLAAAKATGIVVTTKGGVILSIMRQFSIPLKFVGVGEGADDLIPVDPAAYVDTLFE